MITCKYDNTVIKKNQKCNHIILHDHQCLPKGLVSHKLEGINKLIYLINEPCVARWHWTYGHINIVLTSKQKVDNEIPVRSQWWCKLSCREFIVLRTTGNIRIYRPQIFCVRSGINQSYSLEYSWERLSPSSNWKVKGRIPKLNS